MSWRHGTWYGYAEKHCPCDLCMAAMRASRAKVRINLRNKPIPDHVHGTSNGYQNYGCRCDPCTQAQTQAVAAYRAGRS